MYYAVQVHMVQLKIKATEPGRNFATNLKLLYGQGSEYL